MQKRIIKIGKIKMGAGQPVLIKGMIKSATGGRRRVIQEAKNLEKEGCEVLRIAVSAEEGAEIIPQLKKEIKMPIEADIHFDYRLALLSIEKGADCVRLNPQNISDRKKIEEVVRAAKRKRICIRVGVNSGGFKNKMSAEELAIAMAKRALNFVEILEGQGFREIMLSAKAHTVETTVLANRLLYKNSPYPIDLGLTAAGPYQEGLIKSSVAMGILLPEGAGDSLRISLNAGSCEEVRVAKLILQSLGLRRFYPEIISCPTCSRCKVNLREKVEDLKEFVYQQDIADKDISVAFMGCAVNGPGEASCADAGIAFGDGYGVFFKKGEVVDRLKEDECLKTLKKFLKESK